MSESIRKDRRKSPRLAAECPVTFRRFNSAEDYRAVIRNYGRDGMYIEADHRFKPGSQILIRRESCTEPLDCARCDRLQSMVLAQVKWSRTLPEADRPRYGFGVTYTL
jgi:hypothetical protein